MDILLDWIKHNLSMSGFILKSYYRAAVPVNSVEVQQLICKHPALIELDLPNYRFTVDDAISVICELNLLEKFRFQMLRSDYTYFKNQLSGCMANKGMWLWALKLYCRNIKSLKKIIVEKIERHICVFSYSTFMFCHILNHKKKLKRTKFIGRVSFYLGIGFDQFGTL